MEFAFLESAGPSKTLPISPILEARGVKCGAEMCIVNPFSCLSLEILENIYLSLSFAGFVAFAAVKIFCKLEISGGNEAFVALGFACCCCGASL